MRNFYITGNGAGGWTVREDSPYNQNYRTFSGSLHDTIVGIEAEDPQPTNFLWWPEQPWSNV